MILRSLPLLLLASAAAAEPVVLSDETVDGILAMDEGNLYLESPVPKRLHVYRLLALPKRGGPAREVIGGIECDGIRAVVDGNYLYYSLEKGSDSPLYRVAKSGGAPVQIAPVHPYFKMQIAGDWIFFRDTEGLQKISKRGGAISFVQGDVEGYALARGQVWVGVHTRGAGELMLWKTPITGGDGEQLNLTKSSDRAREGLYADGEFIYWSNGEAVMRAEAKKDGVVRELYRGQKEEVVELAGADAKTLFIGVNKDTKQRLLRAPKTGGTPVQISADGWTPFADQTGVYFVENRKEGLRVVRQ
jgi:hypothetical protein